MTKNSFILYGFEIYCYSLYDSEFVVKKHFILGVCLNPLPKKIM